jgi:hypothetical protein
MQLTCDHIYICFCLLFAYKPPTRCNWLNSSQSLWTKQITIDELSCRLLLTKFGFCWFRSRACEFQNSIRVLNLDKQCGPCALHGVPASQDRRRVLCRHLAVADLAWSWHVLGISHWDDAPYSPPFSPWSKISIFDASCMISPSFPSLVRYVHSSLRSLFFWSDHPGFGFEYQSPVPIVVTTFVWTPIQNWRPINFFFFGRYCWWNPMVDGLKPLFPFKFDSLVSNW